MSVPADLKYTADHEWIALDGEIATVGITDHAQEELTDIVYVELPEVGLECEAEQGIAVVESVKAASDIYAPLAGEVVETNIDLDADPSLVNSAPHGKGWMFKMKVQNLEDVEKLMNAEAYTSHIGA